MEIVAYFALFFGSIATICITGYLLTPNNKLPPVVNKKVKETTSVNGCGFVLYGFKVLSEAELMHYGIELSEFYREKYNEYWNKKAQGKIVWDKRYLPVFRTKFLSCFFIPILPVRSEISWVVRDTVIVAELYTIPTKIYWKQAFAFLSPVYSAFTIFSIILLLL